MIFRKLFMTLLLSLAIVAGNIIFPSCSVSGQTPVIAVTSAGHLSFSILGAENRYPAEKSATLKICSSKEVQVHFSADRLAYQGAATEDYALDVTYVVTGNKRTYSFKPGEYLTIRKLHEGEHQFSVFGFVDIKGVEEQPAGSYEGAIWVTVSASGR